MTKEPATELMKKVAKQTMNMKKMKKTFSDEEIKEITSRGSDSDSENDLEKNRDKKERRLKYRKIKRLVKEMEVGNQSRVIVFPSIGEGGWYKTIDFSALYYKYRLADRMGRGCKLMNDKDNFAKAFYVASFQDIQSFAEKFKNIEGTEPEITEDGVYIFKLKKPLSDDEVGQLRRAEETRREKTHNVLKPNRMDPATFQAILMLVRQVFPRVKKLEKQDYRVVGENLARDLAEILMVYFCYADGAVDKKTAGGRLIAAVNKIMAEVTILAELRVWEWEIGVSIGENANNLKQVVLKEFLKGD